MPLLQPTIRPHIAAVILPLLLLAAPLVAGCGPSADPVPPHTDAAPLYRNMVLIPAGAFAMGSSAQSANSDEKPVHTVYLDSYYIDRHEVTNAQYREFVIESGRPAPCIDQPWAEPYNWRGTSFPEGSVDLPVVLVSWHDAQQYCAWVGKRLPTEAEWEKAARGGLPGMNYPRGDTLSFDDGNYDKGFLRARKIRRVGAFAPNGYNLYDMAGNVWEWCQDWYGEDYYKASPRGNPAGPEDGQYRVFRGGAWISDEKYLRCAQRGKNVPDYKSYAVGFRCALSAPPPR